jgi:hypothetical protein
MKAYRIVLLNAFLFSAVLTASDDNATAQDEKPDKRIEVHAVGIYEGATETGHKIHGPMAAVELNRPDKAVVLVLSCYGPVTWEIAVRGNTELRKVYLVGRPPQAVKGLPDDSTVIKTWEDPQIARVSGDYDRNSSAFFGFVRWVSRLTGQGRITSFQGTYRPAAPFLIHLEQADPKLSASYPEPTPESELPEKARGLKFKTIHYLGAGRIAQPPDGSYGDFTLSGPQENSLRPLPDGVTRIAYDPAGDQYYGIAGHDVVKVDLKKQEVEKMELGLDVPPLSWPCEITFDVKRRRLVVGTSGGGGYLYAFSPEKQEWSVISRRPGAFDSFGYSEQEDCLYGVLFERLGDRGGASLAKVNAQGAVVWKMPLQDPVVPSTLATGPGVSTTRVIAVGDYVAILATSADSEGSLSLIYLIDPKSKKTWVTGKSETVAPADSSDRPVRRRSRP